MQPWRAGTTYFWETAPFFRLLPPLVAGIGCYALLPHVLSLTAVAVLAIISLLCFVVAELVKRQGAFIISTSFIAFHLWIFAAGWLLGYYNDIRHDARWFGSSIKNITNYAVRITDAPIEKDKTWKLPVDVVYALQGSASIATTGKAFIYVRKDSLSTYHKGDTLVVPNKWRRIVNFARASGFDYAAYCARNNIFYQQFLQPGNVTIYAPASQADVGWITHMHDWCMAQLDKYIADKATKGLLQAMLLGDEVNLDNDLRQSYAATGIVHIIAISGGNVLIFFAVIAALLWWLKDKKYVWLKYILALPLVWIYVLMAGAPPSAIRAAMMFSIVAIGFALQKNGNGLNQLFAAAVILLCAKPMWLFSVGFQLSFIAVLSLLVFYTPIYKLWTPIGKITKALWAVIVASIAAEILVAPVVVYYFHLFPIWFIIANVLAYLFMSAVLVLAMLIIACSAIPIIAGSIAWIAIWLVTAFDYIIRVLQGYNPEALKTLHLSGIELVLLYTIIAAVAVMWLQRRKHAIWVGLVAACLFVLALCTDEWMASRQPKTAGNDYNSSHIAGL